MSIFNYLLIICIDNVNFKTQNFQNSFHLIINFVRYNKELVQMIYSKYH